VAARLSDKQQSNACATTGRSGLGGALALATTLLCATSGIVSAQALEPPHPRTVQQEPGRAASFAQFLAGGALGLVAHEGGHLFFDVMFDADPGLQKVDFHGIPFFAITHRADLSPRRAYMVASAGFLVQHAGSEWLLTRRPGLRGERAPLAKGVLTFNVMASAAYAGAAFARTGPYERDTRGMADALRIDERWVGAFVLAPAVLDAWRYFRPGATWAAWVSRGVKVALVLLVLR
jgi:hypothetical protein